MSRVLKSTFLVIGLVATIAAIVVNNGQKPVAVRLPGKEMEIEGVIHNRPDDPQMLSAQTRARDSFRIF